MNQIGEYKPRTPSEIKVINARYFKELRKKLMKLHRLFNTADQIDLSVKGIQTSISGNNHKVCMLNG